MTHRSESKTTRHVYNKYTTPDKLQTPTPENTTQYIITQYDQAHRCKTQIIRNHQKLNNEPANMFYEPTQNLSTHNKKHVKSAGPWVSG